MWYRALLIVILGCATARGEVLSISGDHLPGSSEIDAAERTRLYTARSLVPQLRTQIAVRNKSAAESVSEDKLVQLIDAALSSSPKAFQTSVRVENKSYGKVFFADAKLDLSGKWFSDLADRAARLSARQQEAKVASWAATGGLVVVVGLVYVFANAFTRGYYRWRLRLLAASASAAGILLILGVFARMT